MSCPTQKISSFLEKMLFNVFGIHLSYLPSAHLKNFFQKLYAVLQIAIAFLFTVLTKLFLGVSWWRIKGAQIPLKNYP